MIRYFMKKLALALFTICVTVVITFILLRAMPGDIVGMRAMELVNQQGIPHKQAYELAKAQLNYDPSVPIYVQFVKYVSNICRGDLGESLTYRVSIVKIIKKALPWTVFICSISLFISFTLGLALGLIVTWYRDHKWLELFSTFIATVTQSIPNFLVGVILLVVLGINLRLFPFRGAYSIDTTPGFNLRLFPFRGAYSIDTTPGFNIPFILSVMYHAVLPVMAYVICSTGGWMLSMKASAVSILTEDYIMVAKAKGLKEKRILFDYLGRNAIIPLIPGFIVALGGMLGGSMFIESIFGYPGLGFFFARALGTRDFVLIQGLLLLTTVAIIILNILADLIYAFIDPRIKLK